MNLIKTPLNMDNKIYDLARPLLDYLSETGNPLMENVIFVATTIANIEEHPDQYSDKVLRIVFQLKKELALSLNTPAVPALTTELRLHNAQEEVLHEFKKLLS